MGVNMQSIKELYKIGRGPSSSHTLAPERACKHLVHSHTMKQSCLALYP